MSAPTPAERPSSTAPDGVLSPHHERPEGWLTRLGLLARGALIGLAEIVPGVSGGTIALIVGVYETLIRSAGHLVRAGVHGARALLGREGARHEAAHHARQVRWGAVLPIGIGMLAAVVAGAAVLEPVLEDHPVESRAVFAGLILASLVVPARMVGRRWRTSEIVVGLLAAAAAFVLTGLPPAAERDPSLPLVALAAAFAVCALVLPGISGSFLLLTVGLYEATLGAVNDRDLVYLGVFVLGAILGLSVFVAGLQWLLEHRHRITLVVMTGLMAGSLRALWPWQDDDRTLLAPSGDVGVVALLVAAGAAVVVALLVVEARHERRHAATPEHVADVLDPG